MPYGNYVRDYVRDRNLTLPWCVSLRNSSLIWPWCRNGSWRPACGRQARSMAVEVGHKRAFARVGELYRHFWAGFVARVLSNFNHQFPFGSIAFHVLVCFYHLRQLKYFVDTKVYLPFFHFVNKFLKLFRWKVYCFTCISCQAP